LNYVKTLHLILRILFSYFTLSYICSYMNNVFMF